MDKFVIRRPKESEEIEHGIKQLEELDLIPC